MSRPAKNVKLAFALVIYGSVQMIASAIALYHLIPNNHWWTTLCFISVIPMIIGCIVLG